MLNDSISSSYIKKLEASIEKIVLDVLNSKIIKTKYDESLIKLFESSMRYQDNAYISHEEAITNLTSKYEKWYLFDIACMSTWSDKIIDEKEQLFLNNIGNELSLSENTIVSSINSVNYFKKAETIVLSKLNIIRESKNKNENSKSKEFDNKNNELCLELTNLNFSYSSNINKKIIDDLNLIIKKGEKICIYGKSGEGKSTLIDLIIGLIKPSSGSIKFNKQDVNTNLNSWLKLVTYVPQKVFVFDDSLIQNICFKQILSEDEKLKLEKILDEVKLKELIDSLPDGINTNLGNMGFKISGGQMQRIGIARALFRDPKIIILDESTNSLDKKTEQDILSIFNSIDYKDKIIISISHDNQTFKYFDSKCH